MDTGGLLITSKEGFMGTAAGGAPPYSWKVVRFHKPGDCKLSIEDNDPRLDETGDWEVLYRHATTKVVIYAANQCKSDKGVRGTDPQPT